MGRREKRGELSDTVHPAFVGSQLAIGGSPGDRIAKKKSVLMTNSFECALSYRVCNGTQQVGRDLVSHLELFDSAAFSFSQAYHSLGLVFPLKDQNDLWPAP